MAFEGMRLNGPCPTCGCGTPCLQYTTTFTQANSTTVNGFSSEVSGDWSVSSNVLLTLDNNAIIIADAFVADGHGMVTATGWANSSNEYTWVIGSYVDSSNFLYLKFKFNSTTAVGELWERSGGTDTQLSASDIALDVSAGTPVAFTLCWDGSTAKATATMTTAGGLTASLQWSEAYSGAGTMAGLGHSGGTGAVNFTAFSLSRHAVDDATCPECSTLQCLACAAGGDNGWQIVLPAEYSCAGTHVIDDLKLVTIDPLDGTARCYWQSPISGCGGTIEYIRVVWTAAGGPGPFPFGQTAINVQVWSDGVGIGNYDLDDTDPGWPGNACSSFSSTDVPGGGAGDTNPIFVTAL